MAVTGRLVAGLQQTLTATVTPGTATGSVTFTRGTRTLGTAPVVDGVATLTAALVVGKDPVTARFEPGTTSWLGSTGDAAVRIRKSTSTTTATGPVGSVSYGTAAAVTIRVTGADVAPSGRVQVRDENGKVLRTRKLVVADGVGTATVKLPAKLAVGSHQLRVKFLGSSTVGTSSVRLPVVVSKADTRVTLVSSSWTVKAGAKPRVTVRIAGAAQGVAPTGTVRLVVGGSVLSARLVNGRAAFELPALKASTVVVALYGGDARYTGSSATHRVTVR